MENTLITNDRLENLIKLCGSTKHETIAEVGVYKGGSLKTLVQAFPKAKAYGFDTFEGLPQEHWRESEIHKPGDFSDTDMVSVYKFISSENIVLIRGLFPESAIEYMDSIRKTFDFVHIDTDFYEGVTRSIEYFWPKMNEGGIIVFDDYGWPNCPGVKQALTEFGHPVHETENVKYQAWIIK